MDRWHNKVAVVTGASSGIGAACCKTLVSRGMIVVGLARRQELMETTVKAGLPMEQHGRFHAVRCDLSDEEDIKKAFAWVDKQLGGIHVLVNNAGIVRETQLTSENNAEDLRAVLDVNVLAVAFCTREAFLSMKRRGFDGHILIINSIIGHKVSLLPGVSLNLYAPSKHALTAMTEVLRQEFLQQQTKIKITSISPGAVNTDIIPDKQNLPIEFPMLRPEDIADAVAYCIQTPPNVQIHDMLIKPMGEQF